MVRIGFEELKELSEYDQRGERFIEDLMKMNRKLLKLNTEIQYGSKIRMFAIFYYFEIDIEQRILDVCVAEEFVYLLNELKRNFTLFELRQYVSLSSTYSKAVFQMLKRFRNTGVWKVNADEFRSLLRIPKSYRWADIDKRVLTPVIRELSHIFEALMIKKIKARSAGSPVIALEFTFKKEKYVGHQVEKPHGKIICPECGKELILREMNGVPCYCHYDGWMDNASCRAVYETIQKIRDVEGGESLVGSKLVFRNGIDRVKDTLNKANFSS